jgi:hypothetical protein
MNDNTTLRSKKISERMSSISAEAEGAATGHDRNDTSVALEVAGQFIGVCGIGSSCYRLVTSVYKSHIRRGRCDACLGTDHLLDLVADMSFSPRKPTTTIVPSAQPYWV